MDGVTSKDEEPHVIIEHVFLTSDDQVQDQNSVLKAEELIFNYMTNDVSYNTIKEHKFTFLVLSLTLASTSSLTTLKHLMWGNRMLLGRMSSKRSAS